MPCWDTVAGCYTGLNYELSNCWIFIWRWRSGTVCLFCSTGFSEHTAFVCLFVWLRKESWSSLHLMAPVEPGIRSFQFSDSAWGTHPTLRLIGLLSRVKSLLAYQTLLLSTHFHPAPLRRGAERMLTSPGIILSSLLGVCPSLCGGSVWKTLQPQAMFWTVAASYCDVPSPCWQWVCSWTQTPDFQSRFSETCWSVTKLRSNTPYWLPSGNCGVRVFHSCFVHLSSKSFWLSTAVSLHWSQHQRHKDLWFRTNQLK